MKEGLMKAEGNLGRVGRKIRSSMGAPSSGRAEYVTGNGNDLFNDAIDGGA
jgi:hypothetical protein